MFGADRMWELASRSGTGGVYVSCAHTFRGGRFLWGSGRVLEDHSGIIAAIAMVFEGYSANFCEFGRLGSYSQWRHRSAVSAELSGVRAGSRVQTALSGRQRIAMVIIVIGGVTMSVLRVRTSERSRGGRRYSEFLLGVVAGLFAYGGWPCDLHGRGNE